MAMKLEDLVPLRWPSGPLEIARREKSEGFDAQSRQTLARWHDPAALEFLKNTAVDAIVISWAAGLAADAEQQRTAGALIEEARRRNLAVIGWVEGTADPNAAIAAAKSAGLAAVAIRGWHGSLDFPVIAWSAREDVPWDSTAPVVAIGGNVWPGVNIASGGGAASAGPTGVPWLDSNGWYIQMARARLKPPLWLTFDPPGKGEVVLPRSYVKAICDSEAAGGRWLISLDDHLRAGLASAAPAALEGWQQIAAAARFFQAHADWKTYRSLGLVGVIADFAGEDSGLTDEILNLMSRRDLLFRAIWKSQAMEQPFTGLKALIYADSALPDSGLRRKITDFVEWGGLLITGPAWGKEGQPAPLDFETQFDVRALGKGRLALARKAIDDPYELAVDTQLLLSFRNDLVKIYNGASSGCTRYTASPDGGTALLECLSYADNARAQGLRTIWVREKYKSARLWTIGAEPSLLEGQPSDEYVGVEYHLPANAPQVYVALEFES